ncbi:MAG: hypothetical protein GVY33_09800, partial [Alphaproteobacteria bacterium]|nr:hypothetical protein [Alphaproteobacteria bacterium]
DDSVTAAGGTTSFAAGGTVTYTATGDVPIEDGDTFSVVWDEDNSDSAGFGLTITNDRTGVSQTIGTGDATEQDGDLNFDQLGIRVNLSNADLDAGTADVQTDTLTFATGGDGIEAVTNKAVADGASFQLGHSAIAANSTGLLTLTDQATGNETESVKITADTNGEFTGKVEFEGLGITLDIRNYDTTTALAAGAATQIDVEHGSANFQLGVTAGADDVAVEISAATTAALGVSGKDITSQTNAEAASAAIDQAIETVNTQRASLGANMSRIEKINENLATTTENLDAARSTLMDVDVAAEMTEFSKNQVMTQASTAMLAQANQLPQNLMRLLQ